ncbi:MAG: gephyrin-like molybdotransferase Glp [Natrialbaceae archaeon]
MTGHTHSPFKERTTFTEARAIVDEHVEAHGRTTTVPLGEAVGRTVAESITAARNVPHYPRAAMDGYAVRAEDTFGASDRSPQVLRATEGAVRDRQASQVHTGSELPEGADAVVMIEAVEEVDEEIEVFETVGEGENVGPVGEDVTEGQTLYEVGHRLRPSDVGLLKSTGVTDLVVYERPRVAVIPTGEELVQADPAPGEIIETNGLTVSELVESWGGEATYHDVVTDDEDALADAIESNLDRDIVVTTGGSSVGKRDLLPEVVSDLGEVSIHGVGIKPGHPFTFGAVDGTPVFMLPGYPVSCLINAVQFLRPGVKRAGAMPLEDPPSVEARLSEKIRSEPGMRSFARVALAEDEGERVASAVRASGAGVLSSVALSDGWVVVPESQEGIAAGETVSVERWEFSP